MSLVSFVPIIHFPSLCRTLCRALCRFPLKRQFSTKWTTKWANEETTRSSFAASISLETAPPVVVKTIPAAGATDVEPGLTEIRVTYSKAMQDGSWS